jgi:hypothetical protein
MYSRVRATTSLLLMYREVRSFRLLLILLRIGRCVCYLHAVYLLTGYVPALTRRVRALGCSFAVDQTDK